MINFGIIGTNWITDSFIKSAHSTSKWQLTAVYSRTEEAAKSFASKYSSSITTYTSISSLCADTNISAIYIASPNSLHFSHAHTVLEAGKHVILEKPATSTSAELDTLHKLAKEKNVFLLEAYRHLHETNFKLLQRLLSASPSPSSEALPLVGTPLGASLTYSTYSSRYDAVLAGEVPNIFSLDFSGGSLVDIGVYPISFAIRLFGRPVKSSYTPYICPTGVDGGGMILLTFAARTTSSTSGKEQDYTFPVQINQSKCFKSSAPSEIYTANGTITLNATTDIDSVVFWDRRDKKSTELAGKKAEFNLAEEGEEFARILESADRGAAERLEEVSRAVLEVTEKLRKENGIVFGVEKEQR